MISVLAYTLIVLLGVLYLLGLWACGVPFILLVPLFHGVGLGMTEAHYYSTGIGGVTVVAALVMPVGLLSAAVLAAAFRQSYLRRGTGSDLICVGGAMVLYEMCLFAAGLFLELTYGGRWGVFLMTALVSTLAAGVLYYPLKHIGTIGGNLWKE